MAATNFTRDARIESGLNTVGVVEMSFTWRAFAVADGDRVVVGDVFEDGLYIYRDQSLVMRPGPELAFESVTPNGTLSNPNSLAASDSVTWQGEKQFTDNRPQVVFVPATTTTPTATSGPGDSPTPTPTPGPGDGQTDSGLPIPLLVGLVGLVGLLAAGVWYRQRGGGLPVGSDGSTGDGSGPGGVGGPGSADTDGSGTEAGDVTATAGAAGAGAVAGGDGEPPQPSVPDEELLADDDRVVRMLKDHGGRMKQVKIVEETGWSKSKVSMLLSDMEDEGTISKLRVGRENVISLAGHEPEAAGSPFDDEE
jgi:uncharacterized membrane protein